MLNIREKKNQKTKGLLEECDYFNYGRRLVSSIFLVTTYFQQEKKLNVFLLNEKTFFDMYLEKEELIINYVEGKNNFSMP